MVFKWFIFFVLTAIISFLMGIILKIICNIDINDKIIYIVGMLISLVIMYYFNDWFDNFNDFNYG